MLATEAVTVDVEECLPVLEGEKQCRVCGEVYPLSYFAMRNPETGRRDNSCKACRTAAEREHSRKRRECYEVDNAGSYCPEDPWKYLAQAILNRAVLDYKMAKRRGNGIQAPLVSFFQSEWCECLCDLAGVNPVAVRERLHV